MTAGASFLWAVLIGASAAGAYQLTLAVQRTEAELARLDTELVESREAIHVLKAEWAYLTRPERLATLARRHLALVPMEPGQLGDPAALPYAGAGAIAALDREEAAP